MLAYNNIEQVLSLSDLPHLQTLDLFSICLMHYNALAPISGLTNLISATTRWPHIPDTETLPAPGSTPASPAPPLSSTASPSADLSCYKWEVQD